MCVLGCVGRVWCVPGVSQPLRAHVGISCCGGWQTWLGHVPRSDLPELLGCLDAALVTANFETFGIVNSCVLATHGTAAF